MAQCESWFKQDLKKPIKVQMLNGNLFSQDNQGNLIGVKVYDDDEPASLAGTVSANIIRPDGGTVAATGTLDGNKCSVVLPAAAYAVPGLATIVIKLTSSGVVTTLLALVVTIYRASTDTAVDPGTVMPSIQSLIQQINTAVASIPADYSSLWTSLAPAFSTDASYVAGQYVTYNSKVWRFNAAHSGEWAAGDVSDVKLGNEITDLESAIQTGYNEYAAVANGTFSSSTGPITGTSNRIRTDLLSFRKGDKITIENGTLQHACGMWSGTVSSATCVRNDGSFIATYEEITPDYDGFIVVVFRKSDSSDITPSVFDGSVKLYTEFLSIVSDASSKTEELTDVDYSFSENGYFFNAVAQQIATDTDYKYTKVNVFLYRGATMKGITGIVPNDSAKRIAFVDMNDTVISSYPNPNTGNYKYEYEISVPDNAYYVYIPLRIASASVWVSPVFTLNKTFKNLSSVGLMQNNIFILQKQTNNSDIPVLRNGSLGNPSNANAVTSKYIIPIKSGYDYVIIRFNGDETLADEYAFAYAMFKNTTDGLTSSEVFADTSSYPRRIVNDNADIRANEPYTIIPIGEFEGYKHIAVFMWRFMNNTVVPIRIATDQYSINVSYYNEFQGTESEINTKLNNARHIKNNTISPLTLLHFSDIHADKAATGRIISDSKRFGASIDGIICTGDMVNNTAGEIASWWYPQVMTCIGNHDTASYSSETGYDWTALSMADRDAYYIAPFESNWGITHTSGKSYYYKDYATQKVRLIVMDVMLYNENGADATAQTEWFEGLLASAITNNYHVLIAIHAPHSGATAVNCSFSRYNQGTMPPQPDCDTPQVVVDAVATAIANGLHFIGYLVGHTHQDNIWDAEGDGKQLMYCITCGIVSNEAQWRGSDMHRDDMEDAYNLVTVDTANTLVKIIRGGGADIDDHMRTREAICFNYSTGEKVGEVL